MASSCPPNSQAIEHGFNGGKPQAHPPSYRVRRWPWCSSWGGGGCLGEGGSMEAKSGGGGVKIIIFVLDIT